MLLDIVTLDADLENHPEDIPLLLKKLDEGYDVVTGWRERRWRRTYSSIAASRCFSNFGERLMRSWTWIVSFAGGWGAGTG